MKRSRLRRGTSLVGWAFLSAACGAADPQPTLETRVDTVAGVPRVTNRGEAPRWTLVERIRLGRPGGLGEEQPDEFGSVVGVAIGPDGSVYVADGMAKDIRVFAEDGAFVRRFGREGGGPGEFRALTSLGMLGDTLVTLDPGNGRLGLFAADGRWLDQREYRRVSGPDVRIFQTGTREFSVTALVGTMQIVFTRHDATGALESRPVQSASAPNFYVFCRHQRGFVYFVPDWAPSLLRVPAPGGLLLEGWTGFYRLAWLDAQDDTVRVLVREESPLLPTDAEWDDQVAQFDSMMTPLANLQCEPDRPVRPAEKNLVRAIFFNDRGDLWVERRVDTGFALDVFDAGGILQGSVEVPNRVPEVPMFIRGDRLALVEADELGVHTVVIYEVLPDGGNENSRAR